MPKALPLLTTATIVGIVQEPLVWAAVWPGHESYPLGVLDGSDGFVVTAESSAGMLGYSVAGAGDVNNDGFKDILLGESPEYTSTAGSAYVVFGSDTFSATHLDVSILDGINGFQIEGTNAGDFTGTSVAGAGDVNGDGYDDVIVGAWGASSGAGEIMVVFGAENLPAVVDASDLDGSAGFLIGGATTSDAAGYSVASAGDVNNDGAADLLIGAYRADPQGSMSGEAYLIFGSLDWTAATVDLADLGAGGLTFQGSVRREYVGYSVAGAGDVNDDGYSDVIISAYGANEAYVFYGAPSFSSSVVALETLSGTEGFIISVGNDGDPLIVSGAGDMNNDGYGDIAVGHSLADPSSDNSAGATYVVLGGGAIESPLDVLADLNGNNGFVLNGAIAGDRCGSSVSAAGDINQDGYEDIIIGAPGVGNDAGAAYIVFGREFFSSASYALGSMGPEEAFVLLAPSDYGLGGYSVAGAGDTNQDGFPDVVVGAHKSGAAGEAFVVRPHLTGTPPPTPSPTPAPTGPTPAPVRVDGATPAPTINFLVEGVVGGGTVYEGPGIFVRAQELGGEVSLGADRWFDEDTRVSMALHLLQEKSAASSIVGLSATVPHIVHGGGLVYEATGTSNVTVGGLAVQQAALTTSALGGETEITITISVFQEGGVIASGDESTEVSSGDLKISLSVSDWPFCDPSTAPTRNSQETPSTVCPGASSALETGAYLDATLAVQGPSSSKPVMREGVSTTTTSDHIVGKGIEYVMSAARAVATLTMSEWVETDDYGWTKAEELSLSGSAFTVRFPASSRTLYYDPTFKLALRSDEGGFWTRLWFIYLASAVGLMVIAYLLVLAIRTVRRRRTTSDKVSPSFEGVAPAVDAGSGDDTERRKRCSACPRAAGWYRRMRNARPSTPVKDVAPPASRKAITHFSTLFKRCPSASSSGRRGWRRSKKFVTGQAASGATAPGTTPATCGSGGASAGNANTTSPTPDWIASVGGTAAPRADERAAAGAAPEAEAAVGASVPDWLADVAGPSIAPAVSADATGGAGADCYGQGYEGYEDYEGYGGYDGYGYGAYSYDGYYEDGYYGEGVGHDGSGIPAATPPPTNTGVAAATARGRDGSVAGGGGGGGGGGLSWLTNAASTVNAINESEDQEDENKARPSPAAMGPGATRLPPIGGTESGAPPSWMAAR